MRDRKIPAIKLIFVFDNARVWYCSMRDIERNRIADKAMSEEKKSNTFEESVAENLTSLQSAFFEDRRNALTWFYQQIWEGRTTELINHLEVLEGFYALVTSEDPAKEGEGVNFFHTLLDMGAGEKAVATKGCKAAVEKLMKKPSATKAGKVGRELSAYLEAARRSAPPAPKARQAALQQG